MELSSVFSSDTLKAVDLQGREVNVVIADVQAKKFDNGNKLVISFQGKKKALVCNKTNANRIAKLYGTNTDGWIGREITLYVDWVDFQGDTVEAIRVRPPVSRPAETNNGNGKPPMQMEVTERPGYQVSTMRPAQPAQGAQVRNEDPNDPIPFAPEWR